jgi:hypothetical protein
MILNEDKVRRMIDLAGLSTGSSGGSGGGGGSIPAGAFVTPQYYSQNFGLLYKQVTTDGTTGTVTTAFELAAPNMIPTVGTETDPTTGNVVVTSLIGPQVMNALVIGNIMLTYDETNNAIKVVNRDGTTAANFYATGGVSALGYGPGGGGGGGTDLNALLDSINNSAIGSVAPGASNVGKCLVWTADGWAWGTTGEGGGGTVTAITAGTGLTGGTITASGTIALSQDTLTAIASGVTAYGWGDHAQAGYLTSSALTGYATQQWVNQQGFLTSSAISDMATKTWVGQQGFLTSSAISDMATKTWVEDQGYVTSSGVTSVGLSMPTGFSVSGSPITTIGTLSVGIANGYFIPTTTQRTTWNGKQDAISDLSTIRSGAAAGATAVQPSAISDMATQTWVGQQGFITASALSSYLPLTGGTLTGALHMGSAAGASPYIYWGDDSYAYIGEDSDDHITLRGDKGVNILTGSNYELEWNGDTLATQDWVVAQGYLLKSDGMQFYIINDSYVRAQFNPDGGRTAKAQGSGFIEWWASGGYFNHHVGNVEIGKGSSDGDCYLQIGGGRIYWDSTNNALYVQGSSGGVANFYATGGVSALGMSGGGSPSINNLDVRELSIIDELLLNGNTIYMDGGDINDAYSIQTNQLRVGGSSASVISNIYWNGTYLQIKIGSTTYNFRPV